MHKEPEMQLQIRFFFTFYLICQVLVCGKLYDIPFKKLCNRTKKSKKIIDTRSIKCYI